MGGRSGQAWTFGIVAWIALGCGVAGSPARAQWYDPAPLLESVRPAQRATLAQDAGVQNLADLTLYDLDLQLDVRQGTFTLHEDVWFTNLESTPLDSIVLRIFVNATGRRPGLPQRVSVRFEGGQCVSAACTIASDDSSRITVTPAQPLAPGARLRVGLVLAGTLTPIDPSRTTMLGAGLEGMASLGRTEQTAGDYGLVAFGDGLASLASFYAVVARRENGRWETAEDSTMGDLGSDALSHVRARIRLTPSDAELAVTGTIGSDTIVRTERIVTVNAAAVREFALVAGPELEVASRTVNGVVIRSHYLPRDRAAGRAVLDAAAGAFEVFERRFGPYPWVDLDVSEASIVGGAGGIEFSGFCTVASMFYRSGDDGGNGAPGMGALLGALGGGGAGMESMVQSMREFVTAHEVAHQWWHGLVGSDSRAHPFVDESLAQWSSVLYLEERYGAERARHDADTQVRMNYQVMRMQGGADGAVDRRVAAFGTPTAYAGLVYGKGAYLYPALRAELGDTVLFDALRAYVQTYRFRVAPARGFVTVLESRVPEARRGAVRALARRWLDEAHGDEDLGRANPSELVGNMLGIDPSQMPPELAPLLQGLLSGGLGSGANGGAGGGGGLDALLGSLGGAGGAGGADLGNILQQLGGATDLLGGMDEGGGGGGGATVVQPAPEDEDEARRERRRRRRARQ